MRLNLLGTVRIMANHSTHSIRLRVSTNTSTNSTNYRDNLFPEALRHCAVNLGSVIPRRRGLIAKRDHHHPLRKERSKSSRASSAPSLPPL
jgi:hypothetical protein